MTCAQAREEGAVALLLREPIPPSVTEHLAGCPGCAAEMARLEPLPDMLATVDDEVMHPLPSAGPVLLGRMLAEAARRRRQRRSILIAAAAAAVIAIIVPAQLLLHEGGGSVVAGPTASAPPSTQAPTPVASASGRNASTHVWGQVEVHPSPLGSYLVITVGGVPSGTRCRLVVVDAAGHSEPAGSWQASYTTDPEWEVHGTVATAPDKIRRVDVVDEATDKVLLGLVVA